MICIEDKKKCCGCTACASICPKHCIKMVPDNEGFLYPFVDVENCVKCGLCENVCPILNNKISDKEPYALILRNNDEKILSESTSGGAFTAIAEAMIDQKEADIYGAAYKKNMVVSHACVTKKEDLHMFRGSKFVQSNLEGAFQDIKEKLCHDKVVVFSGTPCQVAGLKNFLRNTNTEKLYCIDLVCRGVPSPKLWNIYIENMKRKYNSRIVDARFRSKTYGYKSSTMQLKFENNKVYSKSGRIDPMMKLFTKEMCSRPSCESCAFKGKSRESDLTLFDCKKYTKVTGLKDDDKGYTSVLVHSPKGAQMIEFASNLMDIQNVEIDKLILYCGIMVNSSAKANSKRTQFYEDLGKVSLDEIIQTYVPISKKDRFIEFMKGFLYKTGLIKFARRIKKHEKIIINQ